MKVAQRQAPSAILEATGVEFGAILDGLLPGLLMCLCVVAATTALGATAGAAIGALALGISAAPGAAFGASAGFEAGVALLEGLGLVILVTVIGTSVGDAGRLARRGVHEAWHSVDHPGSRWFRVDHAGRTLADAAAALMRGILQGIVAFLFARGANAAASRVPELVTKLRASKLGEGFAAWVERNWASLIKNERLMERSKPAPARSHAAGSIQRFNSGSREAAATSPVVNLASGENAGKPTPSTEHRSTPRSETVKPATLSRQQRLQLYYDRMRSTPRPNNAEEALAQLRTTLDDVEDAHSGVPKSDPPPPIGQSDGRMYPPLDDRVVRKPDGTIQANTRAHDIECGTDGSLRITNRRTGEVDYERK
ncbi:MAG: DUF6861 domain-containing protein [Polyangiales bacterium]